eukprot:COSAG05_NODE_16673_length_341_cov_0.640496_2_plen_67_part_01
MLVMSLNGYNERSGGYHDPWPILRVRNDIWETPRFVTPKVVRGCDHTTVPIPYHFWCLSLCALCRLV